MAAITPTFAASSQPAIVSDPSAIKRTQKYTLTTTLSAGDVLHFTNLKIPHGATITDVEVSGIHPNGATIFTIGYAGGATSAAAFGSATLSATFAFHSQKTKGHLLPFKLSLSDSRDNGLNYVYPTLTAATVTSATGSLSLGLTVEYTMNKTNW